MIEEPNKREWRMRAAAAGHPQPPMYRCFRRELAPIRYACEDPLMTHRINLHLKQYDRDLEIVYDWATTPGCALMPGHHVYRVVRRGGGPSDDTLQLQFSWQRYMDRPWPQGEPLKPSMDVVEEFKRRDLARMPVKSGRDSYDTFVNDAIESSKEANRKEDEVIDNMAEQWGKDVETYAHKKRNNMLARVRRAQKRRELRTRKVTVPMP